MGGAIYFLRVGSVDSCLFMNNQQKGESLNTGGGAIFFNDIGNVTNSDFIKNAASGLGGAIFAFGDTKVLNSSFSLNDAKEGGAIFFNDDWNVQNSTFEKNRADNGGALYVDSSTEGQINNSTFIDNAADEGGSIYSNYGVVLLVNDSTFDYNVADYGAAIYVYEDALINNSEFTQNTALVDGGAIYFYKKGSVENSIFTISKANKNGGAIFFNGEGIVTHSEFRGSSTFDAGAIFFNEEGSVEYSNFILSTASANRGAIIFNSTGKVDNCNFNASQSGSQSWGGAIIFNDDGIVNNTRFRFNIADDHSAAIEFKKNGTVENSVFDKNIAGNSISAINFGGNGILKNCNFTNNLAKTGNGAVMFNKIGTVESCNFDNNTGYYGAITFSSNGTVNNSRFTYNQALFSSGAAITGNNARLNISNSLFLNNKAKSIYVIYRGNYIISFAGQERYIHAINAQECTFKNVTYWNGEIVNSDDVPPLMSSYPGINLTVEVYDANNNLVDNVTLMTDENNLVYYSPYLLYDGTYSINAYHADDSYYSASNNATGTFTLSRNSTSVKINMTDNEEFNYNDCNITFSVENRTQVRVIITDDLGNVVFNQTTDNNYTVVDLIPGEYNITVYNEGNKTYATSSDSKLFKINKLSASITAQNKAFVINYGGKYSITLKDADGNLLVGKMVTFTLKGKNIGVVTTDKNGVATITLTSKILKSAKAGKRDLVVKFGGDAVYKDVSKTVKVTIKKEKTKITAKKKTFKKSKKVKKYKIKLKNSKGKAVKKVKVTLKIKGKTFKAKTNSKGKAVFKIKKLTKKGKFKAKIAFKGNGYYLKAVKKVKIKLK